MRQEVIFLVGPTASGKSEAAAALAKKINGEIISCDSMQIYKGMGILTSAPGLSLLKKVKHHLIGVVSPEKDWDVFRYRAMALKAMEGVIARGKIPVFAGGTGLYVSVLMDGIFPRGGVSPAVRAKLEALDERELASRLASVDPEAAARIHLHDKKRMVRALEVYEATGKVISRLQKTRHGLAEDYDVKVFCLNMDRQSLYSRIDSRVDRMYARGLVKETQRLSRRRLSRTARYAIGIRELKGYFAGDYSFDEAKCLIKRNSRRYAKRQLTWFRKDKRIHWINIKDGESARQVAGRILKNIA
jgi:tRNA dimethylallyltransferase